MLLLYLQQRGGVSNIVSYRTQVPAHLGYAYSPRTEEDCEITTKNYNAEVQQCAPSSAGC